MGIAKPLTVLVTGGYISTLPQDPLATNDPDCYTYEYTSSDPVASSWYCQDAQGDKTSVNNYGYVIRFETEKLTLPWLQFSSFRNNGHEYCATNTQ